MITVGEKILHIVVCNNLFHPHHHSVVIFLFLSFISSDGHHLSLWRGCHGDHIIPFLTDCLRGTRIDHVMPEQRLLLGGEDGRGLAKNNNLSTGPLQQELNQLFLCRVEHQYTIHLHQPMGSIRDKYENMQCRNSNVHFVHLVPTNEAEEYSNIAS